MTQAYDRDAVIKAIDKLHEEADWMWGRNEAEALSRALGWTGSFRDGPDGDWIRARLNEVLK